MGCCEATGANYEVRDNQVSTTHQHIKEDAEQTEEKKDTRQKKKQKNKKTSQTKKKQLRTYPKVGKEQ